MLDLNFNHDQIRAEIAPPTLGDVRKLAAQSRQAPKTLVGAVRGLGIDVGEQVTKAQELLRRTQRIVPTAEASFQSAQYRLLNAGADDFDDAADAFEAAAIHLNARQTVAATATDNAENRLHSAVIARTWLWEYEIVERFNEIVDTRNLNNLVADLPDFNHPNNLNVFTIGEKQGVAIDTWKSAANDLRPLWNAYVAIASLRGHNLGPSNLNNNAENLLTAYVLGDPPTFRHAEAVATAFVSVDGNLSNTAPFQALTPFVVPPLFGGYDLRLSTLAQARAARNGVNAPTPPPGYTDVLPGELYVNL